MLMLTQLHIQNIAVIHKAAISFSGGFNVFTGETGAGKTILISAIDAVLGERTPRDIIRSGEDRALVSALFEDIPEKAIQALEEQGYSAEDGSVLIVREITAQGKNNCKINGMPANVAVLKEISSLLINIHGQRDTSQLLDAEKHLGLIDMYGENQPALDEYTEAYRHMRSIERELDSLITDDAQKAQRIDMLNFQINEIDEANLDDPDEEDELVNRRKVIRNSEKILDGLRLAYSALSGDGEAEGINSLFSSLTGGISDAAEYIGEMSPLSQRLEEIGYELQEAEGDILRTLDEFEFDSHELDAIESRLDVFYRLKRKYGADLAEIISFRDKIAEELESITTSEKRAGELKTKLEAAAKKVDKLASALSKRRMDALKGFIRDVEAELKYLDMASVSLSVAHEKTKPGPTGIDSIEFMAATNVGEAPKPLGKIASGGETSRMMLAIKNVLAGKDGIDTLIFDEVDSGVSGRAARKIGAKLKQVSRERQVICVTHLAQVAAFSDKHLYIYKEIEDGRTYTRVKPLENEDVFVELARITSGDLITDAAIENARELYMHAHTDTDI